MFFVALGAGVPLLLKCQTGKEFFVISIYVICALLMFGISSLYHRINWTVEKRQLWRKLDHCGIYLMIAGNFTPVSSLSLSSKSSQILLITIWAIAAFGIVKSMFFMKLPKAVNTLLFLLGGYQIIFYFSELRNGLGNFLTALVILGGVFYTIGALCYAFKWPKLKPEIMGYHEIFHIFVNLGATAHYFVVHQLL